MDRPVRPWLFWPKVDQSAGPEGCWRWLGRHNPDGYAIYSKSSGHRAAYRLTRGEVPADLELDHLCRNRWCVNPAHLEAVTHAVNLQRALKSECPNGHPYVPGSYFTLKRGGRHCKTCQHAAERRAVPRATAARAGHSVVRHPRGGWGCACGVWLGTTQAAARVAMRSHPRETRRAA